MTKEEAEIPRLIDIIDTAALQSLLESFHALSGVPVAIIDLEGRVLVGVGWQDICTRFHRVNPDSCRHCVESDTELSAGIPAGEIRLYKCKNNMWDIATPIIVGANHIGNVFLGQFFFDDEPLDYELFRTQARQYGSMKKSISPLWKLSPYSAGSSWNRAWLFSGTLPR